MNRISRPPAAVTSSTLFGAQRLRSRRVPLALLATLTVGAAGVGVVADHRVASASVLHAPDHCWRTAGGFLCGPTTVVKVPPSAKHTCWRIAGGFQCIPPSTKPKQPTKTTTAATTATSGIVNTTSTSSQTVVVARQPSPLAACALHPSSMTCDNVDPVDSGCAVGGLVVGHTPSVDIIDTRPNGTGGVVGRVDLMWSPTCLTNWIHVVSHIGKTHIQVQARTAGPVERLTTSDWVTDRYNTDRYTNQLVSDGWSNMVYTNTTLAAGDVYFGSAASATAHTAYGHIEQPGYLK